MWCDGGGLYLQVTTGGGGLPNKSWLFRFKMHGQRERQMGLGSFVDTSLAEAREKAADARKLVKAGTDPIDARNIQQASARLAADLDKAKGMTFDQCRDAYITAHQAGWGTEHAQDWKNSLEQHVGPVFGHLPVQAVDTEIVMKALSPIWTEITVTAARIRNRVESVLDWATSMKARTGENPARWDGHLENLLPKPSKVHKVRHYPALPYAQIGAFMVDLRARDGMDARSLEFAILTAGRTDEALAARKSEFDFDAEMWAVPDYRMKSDRPHRVPLTERAIAIVKDAMRLSDSEFVFRGERGPRQSKNIFLNLLGDMNEVRKNAGLPLWVDPKQGNREIVPHGFRSTFRDWAADWAPSPAEILEAAKRGELVEVYPNELVEVALAHTLDDKTEEAYRRTDMIEKRRRLMSKWAEHCDKVPVKDNVIDLPIAAASSELVPVRQAG